MIETFRDGFRNPEIRKKMLYTIMIIILFRVGGNIPVPGIDRVAFTNLIERFGQLGSMMDIMSGGALKTVSIFAMGITPYINASIIIQLLTVAIPALERLAKEGETGRKKIQKITRITACGVALLQSIAFWYSTRSAGAATLPNWLNGILVILSFTAGSMIVVWMGESINAHGIGNGISIIIFSGIISRIPSMITNLWMYSKLWSEHINFFVSLLFVIIVVIAILAAIIGVLYVQMAERRIPVQYAKRIVGRKQYGGNATYLPIRVNQSGVLPVIFAMSILQLPNLIVSFFFANSTHPVAMWFKDIGTNPLYYIIQALLILGFTFFYSMIQFNPLEIANNLQKNGGFIPGIRPGRPTAEFIGGTSRRLCWFDALFLIIVTLAPMLVGTLTNTHGLWFGGTAIIIITGTCTELMDQLESHLMMRQHSGFLN
ncbi:MAG: preprotein translocase subunit SecY [Clostridiaceae bacterium]|nr:preprotein translocase subunit SecY [Clostridiaceae bacterium]